MLCLQCLCRAVARPGRVPAGEGAAINSTRGCGLHAGRGFCSAWRPFQQQHQAQGHLARCAAGHPVLLHEAKSYSSRTQPCFRRCCCCCWSPVWLLFLVAVAIVIVPLHGKSRGRECAGGAEKGTGPAGVLPAGLVALGFWPAPLCLRKDPQYTAAAQAFIRGGMWPAWVWAPYCYTTPSLSSHHCQVVSRVVHCM